MIYHIITSENFSDMERIQREAVAEIKARYQKDQFDNYKECHFAVMGDDAIEKFKSTYGFDFSAREEIKTDGKTSAKLVPFVLPDFYYNARSDKGAVVNIYPHTIIHSLVEFDGILFNSYSWDRKGGSRTFYLFNDNTDYRNYLPYNWEKTHPEPNKVGTITDKKMTAWKEWLLARKNAALEEKAKRGDDVALFLSKLEKIDASKCKEFLVTKTSGRIVRNGIKYSYTITDGVIDERIEVNCITGSKLEAFNKMVEGKY